MLLALKTFCWLLSNVLSFTFLQVDETRFELVRLRLQRNALPLELFVHFVFLQAFWLISYFVIIEFTCFKQFLLLSPAKDSNFLLSICRRMHTAMSASRTFAESKGFEPLHRFTDVWFSKPLHYRSANSPLFWGWRKIRTFNPVPNPARAGLYHWAIHPLL